MISMGKILCKICNKMVDEVQHRAKIDAGLIHKIRNVAGNPLSPRDTTIHRQFLTASVSTQ